MTEPRAGDSAPESHSFHLPPFVPPAPTPAPWPLNAAPPPFSTPQPAAEPVAPDETFASFEPEPLPLQESVAPQQDVVADDDEVMPWEMPWQSMGVEQTESAPSAPAWAAPAALEADEPAWLSLDDAEEEPVALADLAPAEPELEEVPAWLSWMEVEEGTEESEPISGEVDLVEVGDVEAPAAEPIDEGWSFGAEPEPAALFWAEAEDVADAASMPTDDAEYAEYAEYADVVEVVEPRVAEATATPFVAVAERLERLASELRTASPAALLAGAGRDPLEVLILGYALGQMHAAREGERD